MNLSTTEAVLLDMDGTLVLSGAAVERAWLRWAGEYGVEAPLALVHAHGSTAVDAVRRLRPDLGDGAVAAAAGAAGAHELVELLARLNLPCPVVYDSEDPAVTPECPRTGSAVALAGHQALLLAPTR